MINFWTTWCQPCVDELPSLNRLREKLGPDGFEVVGVAVQDADQNLKDMVTKLHLTFPIAVDKGNAVQHAYKVQAFPESFVLDKQGRIVFLMDPEHGEPVAKVIGSREWDSPKMVEILRSVMQAS